MAPSRFGAAPVPEMNAAHDAMVRAGFDEQFLAELRRIYDEAVSKGFLDED
jgi:hypothetical protein